MTAAPTIERPASAVERGAVVPGAVERMERYDARCTELASVAGVLNAAHGHLVALAVQSLADDDHVGPGLHSFAQFLCWRLGVSTTTAKAIERIARRADELPTLVATLQAGEISLEQAAVVASYVPAAYEASATELAKSATVTQLKSVLPAYRERKQAKRGGSGVSVTTSDDGRARISGSLDADQGELVAKALEAMGDDLLRQRRADAKAAGTPEHQVDLPTRAEALAALAETALAAQQAAHPGSERYLVSYHLQATADGRLLLLDEKGLPIEDHERRRILCDHRFEHVLHGADGTPLSVGRKTRHIDRRLRRAVLHRHHGRCAVPGCHATHGLEIHHIVHWEDGGPTDTQNLVAICRRHHRAHHQGQLHISGNADLAAGTPGGLCIGRPGHHLAPVGTPDPVAVGTVEPLQLLRAELEQRVGVIAASAASTPTGERLDRRTFHLSPSAEPVPEPDVEPAGTAEPVSHRPPRRRHRTTTGRRATDGPPEAHGPPAA